MWQEHLIQTGLDWGQVTPKGETNLERNPVSFTLPLYETFKILLFKKHRELPLPSQVEVGYVEI